MANSEKYSEHAFAILQKSTNFAGHNKTIGRRWKEHSSLLREKEETSTVSDQEWKPLTVEEYWPAEEPKAERDLQFLTKENTRLNLSLSFV